MKSSMPENERKELLSKKYLEVIASRTGFKTTRPEPDSGVDLSFTFPVEYQRSGRKRILDSGKYLDIQLKATTEKYIIASEKHFSYDLNAKSYDDLVQRRDGITPLILVVFILPDEDDKWVSVDTEELILRKTAFWFYPDENHKMSNSSSTVRIKIPYDNHVNIEFFNERFDDFYSS